MQVAIVSDIHGNRHAFEAVLDDVRAAGAPRRSGAWATSSATAPTPTTASRSRASTPTSAWPATTTWRSPASCRSTSSRAARRSPRAGRRRSSTPDHLRLPGVADAPQLEARRVGLYHASPRDPVWEYVLCALLAELCLDAQPERVGLDRPLATSRCRSCAPRASRRPATARRGGDDGRHRRRRVAAQPGQRRPAARRRPARGLAAARHRAPGPPAGGAIEYDIAGAAAAIRAARLPDSLAERLEYGQ